MRAHPVRTLSAALVVTAAAAAPATAIVGGEPDGDRHPMVGLMVAQDEAGTPLWRCSGTLVSSTGFVTAGHCTSDDAGGSVARVELFFDDDLDTTAQFRGALEAGDPTPCTDGTGARLAGYPCTGDVSGTAHTHPAYDPADFTARDLGVVVLDQPWALPDGAAYAELPEVGAFDSWRSNDDRAFTAVGYGVQKQYGSGAASKVVVDNQRRVVGLDLTAINKAKTGDHAILLANSTNKGGTCTGDSGGPTFVGESLVLAGVTSYGVSQNTCGGQGGAYRLDREEDRAWLASMMGSL